MARSLDQLASALSISSQRSPARHDRWCQGWRDRIRIHIRSDGVVFTWPPGGSSATTRPQRFPTSQKAVLSNFRIAGNNRTLRRSDFASSSSDR